MGFLGGAMIKNPPANARDTGDTGSIFGSERSPGGGNGNPLQFPCLGNPVGRGAWGATVHGVAKNQTCVSTYTHILLQKIFRNIKTDFFL